MHLHKAPHLLVEVHLVPLLPVHLDLLYGGPQWNEVALDLEKHSPKFCHSTLIFLGFLLTVISSTTYL